MFCLSKPELVILASSDAEIISVGRERSDCRNIKIHERKVQTFQEMV